MATVSAQNPLPRKSPICSQSSIESNRCAEFEIYKILQDNQETISKKDGVEKEDYEIDKTNAIPKRIQGQVTV